jgi:hypothetical protein
MNNNIARPGSVRVLVICPYSTRSVESGGGHHFTCRRIIMFTDDNAKIAAILADIERIHKLLRDSDAIVAKLDLELGVRPKRHEISVDDDRRAAMGEPIC